MDLYLQGHDYRYAVEQMLMTLFPGQRPRYPDGEPGSAQPAALLTLSQADNTLTAQATLWWEGSAYQAVQSAPLPQDGTEQAAEGLRRQLVRLAFYQAGVAALGQEPPWGALTGVRPVKLPTRVLAQGGSAQQAHDLLTQRYRVTPSRADLAVECAQAALSVQRTLTPRQMSLYLGIPFCPSRCAYCSFISADVKGALALVEPYVDALCQEIAAAGEALRREGITIPTAYFGGGTPTTLSAPQLDRVLTALCTHLPMEDCYELTVEAGRPDTITADKLAVLRRHGVHRISINPQTMEDAVLQRMGRAHTAQDIRQAMALARQHFGGLVNMDLIAGLPGDTPQGFARTLHEVLAMDPANITVHTLALKKGARLMEEQGALCAPHEVAEMLALAESTLRGAGYAPYYLYRQKYMSGSFENVGWAKPDTLCAYNIVMMEELQSVLSLGAGGVTKLVNPRTGEIRRLSNPKFPREYLDALPRLCADKAQAAAFQAQLAAQAANPPCQRESL